MHVNFSGWNEKHGAFSCDVYINERKEDYELHYSDGSIKRQCTPFEDISTDWNHDGDVYSQFGAWFTDPKDGRNEFWSVTEMVSALVDAMDPDSRHYGRYVVDIPGINIPLPQDRPRLDDRIRQSENRAMHQEAERNRKMDALGIRPPGEPWAR